MNRALFTLRCSLFIVFLAGCAPSQTAAPPAHASVWEQTKQQIRQGGAATLTVGADRVEITPPVGTPLAGYGKRKGKPSVGIRDPLYVRALALSDGQDTVVILSADLLVFPQPVAEQMMERISRELNLPRQAIILAATHTHSGTGAIGHGFLFEKVFGRYDPAVVEGIAGRAAWAAQQAVSKAKPARWSTAEDPGFLRDRVENRAVPGGPVDPALKVLILENGREEVCAVVVNAAAHPTLMDSQDLRFSADFPGEVCRRVEEQYPGAVCLFLNGAAGDARPADSIGGTPDQRIERFGGAIAEGVTGLISRSRMKERADVSAWGGPFALPPPQIRFGPFPLPFWIERKMRPTSVFLSMAAMDGFLMVPLSAELTTEIGVGLQQKLAALGMRPLLAGYANGYLGYAVAAPHYRSGSYEAWMTWYGPHFGDFLIDHLGRLAALGAEK